MYGSIHVAAVPSNPRVSDTNAAMGIRRFVFIWWLINVPRHGVPMNDILPIAKRIAASSLQPLIVRVL